MQRRIGLWAATAIAALVVFGTASPALAAKKPVKVAGSVNVKGAADVSGDTSAALEIDVDNFFFSPTFTKASPGETITVKLENTGSGTHTFTSDALGVDEQLAPGATKTVEVTLPTTKGAFRVYCQFHDSSGMQGAIYTKAGAKATDKAPR